MHHLLLAREARRVQLAHARAVPGRDRRSRIVDPLLQVAEPVPAGPVQVGPDRGRGVVGARDRRRRSPCGHRQGELARRRPAARRTSGRRRRRSSHTGPRSESMTSMDDGTHDELDGSCRDRHRRRHRHRPGRRRAPRAASARPSSWRGARAELLDEASPRSIVQPAARRRGGAVRPLASESGRRRAARDDAVVRATAASTRSSTTPATYRRSRSRSGRRTSSTSTSPSTSAARSSSSRQRCPHLRARRVAGGRQRQLVVGVDGAARTVGLRHDKAALEYLTKSLAAELAGDAHPGQLHRARAGRHAHPRHLGRRPRRGLRLARRAGAAGAHRHGRPSSRTGSST